MGLGDGESPSDSGGVSAYGAAVPYDDGSCGGEAAYDGAEGDAEVG